MNKSILVIDTPECCYQCKFFHDSFDYPVCIATGESRGYLFNGYKERMKNCPLILMPEKQHNDLLYDEYSDGWVDGWNRCIKCLNGELNNEQ